MKHLFKLICLLLFLNCNNETVNQNGKETITEKSEIEKVPYSELLEKINFKKLKPTKKKKRFFKFINQDVPTYWTGTKWDFNGVTRTPQQGKIACGYFVTNTLVDFGFNIKRIWLAQQASSIMIDKLCETSSIKRFSKLIEVENYLSKQKENDVFIVGLDFHTGYIIKDGNDSYFLHSNYINREGVMKEKLNESKALAGSNLFVIGSLIQNSKLF